MLRLGFCHDQVSLSPVMNLYCFVYDFVILSLIDNYDDVFGDLKSEDLCEKNGRESKNSEG